MTPRVGMPATIVVGSDWHAATVVWVSDKLTKIRVRRDNAKRTDANGMSDDQQYEYSDNPDGQVEEFHRNLAGSYGNWRIGHYVRLGERRTWHDFNR